MVCNPIGGNVNQLHDLNQMLIEENNNLQESYEELFKIMEPFVNLCIDYNLDFNDLFNILEKQLEGQVYDFEVVLKEAYLQERTCMGRSVLRQLGERVGVSL